MGSGWMDVGIMGWTAVAITKSEASEQIGFNLLKSLASRATGYDIIC